jgi:hypothetical protein
LIQSAQEGSASAAIAAAPAMKAKVTLQTHKSHQWYQRRPNIMSEQQRDHHVVIHADDTVVCRLLREKKASK